MNENFTPYRTMDYLKTPEAIQAYLEELLADNDPSLFLHGLGQVARDKGMTELSKQVNVSREGLYKGLAVDGNASFKTVVSVLNSLGFKLTITPLEK